MKYIILVCLIFPSFNFAIANSDIDYLKKEVAALKIRVAKLEEEPGPFSVRDIGGKTLSQENQIKHSRISEDKKASLLQKLKDSKEDLMKYIKERDQLLKEIDEKGQL